jgi:hypothetical protein
MAETRNVQIPYHLFTQIIGFFEYLSISHHEFPAIFGCDAILSDLRAKQQRLNLHAAYASSCHAKDD